MLGKLVITSAHSSRSDLSSSSGTFRLESSDGTVRPAGFGRCGLKIRVRRGFQPDIHHFVWLIVNSARSILLLLPGSSIETRRLPFRSRMIILAPSNRHNSSCHSVTRPARIRIHASGLTAVESFGWFPAVGIEPKLLS